MYVCSKCGVEKPKEAFGLREITTRWRSASCKLCEAERQRRLYAANGRRRESVRTRVVRDAAYLAAKKAAANARRKAYLVKNKGVINEQRKKYRADNIKSIRAYKTAHRALKPELHRAQLARYRSAKLRATPAWADQSEMQQVYALAALKTELTGSEHHVDHIVPLKSRLVCGLHVEWNLQVLAATNNMSKGNRWWPNMP